MKKNFYISIDILSGSKTKDRSLEKIIQNIESECKETDLLEKIIDFLDVNFQGFVFLSVDEISLDNDFSDQIDDIIKILENQLPGGCSQDSKVEWYSDYLPNVDMWYKNDSEWEFSQYKNDQSSFRIPDWDSDSEGLDYFDEYY